MTYRRLGDFQKADEALSKALELDVNYAPAWENKGYLYADANMLEEAVEYLNTALTVGEPKAGIWICIGLVRYIQQRFEEAIEAYEKALEIEPNNVKALNNEGIAYHVLSQLREERESIRMLEKAVEYFERSLAIDPNKSEIWNNYGVVLGFLRRFKASHSAFDKAIYLSPDYGNAYFNKARIYLQSGDKKNALKQLKIAVEKDGSLYERAKRDLTLRKLKDLKEFAKLMPQKATELLEEKK